MKLPNLSPTMETGTLVSWAKNEGDKISEGDLLAEVETDKATMGLEATDEGFLAKILVPAGSKDVPIGTEVCVVVKDEASIGAFKDYKPSKPAAKPKESPTSTQDSSPPPAAPSQPKEAPVKAEQPAPKAAEPCNVQRSGDRVFVSPLARRLAQEQNISLESLAGQGSGTWGEVRAADLKRFVESGGATRAAQGGWEQVPLVPGMAFADIPLSAMRSTIAKRLTQSKQSIPHYYLTVDISLDEVLALRERINSRLQKDKKAAAKLSVNDFLIKAIAKSCLDVPECNSAWMDSFVRQYATVDVSVAVATPNGLITPIVFGAETKGLKTINEDVVRLAEKARAGKLQPQEYQGGTITISNLGMYGIKNFSAIINPPQACILAVGSAERRIVPNEKSPAGYRESTYLGVTLCCDHRVVDGAVGARWLQSFKQYLEDPSSMLL